MCVCIYIYIYIYTSLSLYIYIYIHILSNSCVLYLVITCSVYSNTSGCMLMYLAIHTQVQDQATPSPPTKSFDFREFVSSKPLILKGGNSHVCCIL